MDRCAIGWSLVISQGGHTQVSRTEYCDIEVSNMPSLLPFVWQDSSRYRAAGFSPGLTETACLPAFELVPNRSYAVIMSIQIALRLPESVVEYIDAQVLAGRAKSRADVVARFVERDRRRERASHDIEVLLADRAEHGGDELDLIAAAVAATPLDLD